MSPRVQKGLVLCLLFGCTPIFGQAVAIGGRVVDETGAGIPGTRVEARPVGGGATQTASSDQAGKFILNLPAAGDYTIRAERG